EEMSRLEATGTYTDDEINHLDRGDVAQSHGGDSGGKDRPPPHYGVPLYHPSWLKVPKEQKAALIADIERQSSATQEYPSLIDTFFVAHTVNGEFLRDEDRRIYDDEDEDGDGDNGEVMINSIKNGDQPLPCVTQMSIAGTTSTEQPPLKDKSMCNKIAKDLWDALARHMLGSEYGEQDRKDAVLYEYETFKATKRELLLDTYIRYLQVINDLKKCVYSKDNCELNFKFLNNLQPEWKQLRSPSPLVKKGEFNSDFYPMVDFIAASPLRIETTDEGTYILATVDGIERTVCESSLRRNLKLRDKDGIVSIPDTKIFENLTLMGIVTLFDTMLVHQGEGSGTPTQPHHTPFSEADTSHPSTLSISLPSIPTAPIPPVTQPDPTLIRQYSRRARIAQSSALLTVADEHASPVRDVNEGKACPTESGFIADQDRATIAKSSTLPHDSEPRVTSPAADEGSMQHTISELMALCTSLQRQYSELHAKFQAQEEENFKLKERVKVLEEREDVAATQSGDDAPIKGRIINEGEAAVERISNDSEEIARVLTSMNAATVLARGIDIPTGSGFIPTAGPPATVISTGSEVSLTASPIVTRRKGKEVMEESDTPKKKRLQE
nr:hypothetical protein [Tanacetum cinerariifolium]